MSTTRLWKQLLIGAAVADAQIANSRSEGVMKALPIVFGSILLAVCAESSADVRLEKRPEVALTSDAAQRSGRPVIHVDDDAGPGGDGSGRFPFDNIAEALARAASLGGAVVVVDATRASSVAHPNALRAL